MKLNDDSLQKLFDRARMSNATVNATPPPGFASRVAARWAAHPSPWQRTLTDWERWCSRTAWCTAAAATIIVFTLWQRWIPALETHDLTLDIAQIATGDLL